MLILSVTRETAVDARLAAIAHRTTTPATDGTMPNLRTVLAGTTAMLVGEIAVTASPTGRATAAAFAVMCAVSCGASCAGNSEATMAATASCVEVIVA
jgi:hypothetical protein